ncbi:uncharacterized protein LOC117642863 [Thrips palmi]|uniref:Uncharacterized protein LOC117642863 n=1 Tax=Thrips palmi TaxID=161013 RepID=A0A6P8YK02_THRPL|nr:uncharacterized protein LOC117642863 [Thrips palmi]
MNEASGKLSDLLAYFKRETGDRQAKTLWRRINVSVRNSKFMLFLVFVNMITALADILTAESLHNAQFGLRLIMGTWASAASTIIFTYRGQLMGTVFQRMADVSSSLEQLEDSVIQDRFRRHCKLILRVVKIYTFLSILSMSGLGEFSARGPTNWQRALSKLFHQWKYGDLSRMQLDPRDSITSWVFYLGLLFQIAALPPAMAAYFLLACIVTIHMSLAEGHAGIGRALKIGKSLSFCANLQRNTLAAALEADYILADLMPFFCAGIVGLPLFSSVEVVTKGLHADLFAFVSCPLILTSFAALCEAGDRQRALRGDIGERAFFGPWLGESPQQRRVRISMMQVITRGPSQTPERHPTGPCRHVPVRRRRKAVADSWAATAWERWTGRPPVRWSRRGSATFKWSSTCSSRSSGSTVPSEDPAHATPLSGTALGTRHVYFSAVV